MSVTALTLCTDAMMDLGIIGQGETPSAADIQLVLRRLNSMVNSWAIQSLTVPAVQRQVFPLIANKQTYTIGPGGDFDLPRPTAQSIQGAGLLLNGFGSPRTPSSLTAASSFTATVTLTAHGLSVGDEVFIDGATQTGYNGLQTVESVLTANTFTYTLDKTVTSPAAGILVVYANSPTGVEIPRALYTDDAYQSNQIKQLSNSQFTGVYYNATASPFGLIWLWPKPNTAQNQLVLYLNQTFAGFADLTTAYTWPDTPGYLEALQYNLETRLIGPFGVSNPVIIQTATIQAGRALALIKRANYKLADLPIDPGLTSSYSGGYNINSGTGGGSTS